MSREVEVCCLPVPLIDAEDACERGGRDLGEEPGKEASSCMMVGDPFLLYIFINFPAQKANLKGD